MRIVIDLSNLAYICFYGYQVRNKDSYNKQEYLKLCNSKIFAIKSATKATEIVFAKDNYPKRKELDEDYKSNRVGCKYPIKKDLIEYLRKKVNAKIYEAKDTEADDVMAYLLKSDKIDCIVTTDQDLLQAIKDGKQLFNPVTMEFWNKEKLDKKYQLDNYKDVLWYKSFFGDASDCIPKVGDRIPRKIVASIINEHSFHSWKELFKELKAFPAVYKKIDKQRLKLNYKLVKLNTNIKIKEVK